MQTVERLQSLSVKVSKIIAEKRLLTNKNLQLEKELEDLKTQLAAEKQKTVELNNKMKIIKLAQNIGSGESGNESTELKRKINEYIKEIDNCIAILNE